jgi:hypothetical protein
MVGFVDLCRFFPTAMDSTDWTVDVAVQGYLNDIDSLCEDGEVYHIRSETPDLMQWEVSTGIYTQATNTFARTDINYSSDGGAKVDFAVLPQCAVVMLAADLGFPRGYRGSGPPTEDVS